MRDDLRISDLTFPTVKFGERETPWDLKVLLYFGGAKHHPKLVGDMIKTGRLGDPLFDRLELVRKIHGEIDGALAGGGSPYTAKCHVGVTRQFFSWAEGANLSLTLATIERTYLQWADSLDRRCRILHNLKKSAAYSQASAVGSLLDAVLERSIGLVGLTRLEAPHRNKSALGSKAEKQNLEETFAFGSLLQDICDGLTVDVVLKGSLPIRIPLRAGGEIVEWCGRKAPPRVVNHDGSPEAEARPRYRAMVAARALAAFEAEGTLRTRSSLANRRCEAELLMFIGQTGMNFSQAHQLKLRQFFYASHLDGYQVRDRKQRRGGEVLFEIFKAYKSHFERYLEWRRELFADSDLLFPFVRTGGRAQHVHPQFRLRDTCKGLGIRFVPPQALRNTRVNWLLRRSGDADQTAEMAQHTKETLLKVYERPSQQRAMGEVMRFWSKHDPASARTTPVALGECNGTPVPVPEMPKGATSPDCIRPSGCLWCEHHRDVDSQDYVWSLACFRHLKVIEVSKWHPPRSSREVHPGQHAIDRMSAKLCWFRESNAKRCDWLEEALARVEEGTYHPDWKGLIEGMEGSA